jgi:hypothetical protein
MHLVVDSDWAKAHPRQAAKIQVAYLIRIARRRNRSASAEPRTPQGRGCRMRRRALSGPAEGP